MQRTIAGVTLAAALVTTASGARAEGIEAGLWRSIQNSHDQWDRRPAARNIALPARGRRRRSQAHVQPGLRHHQFCMRAGGGRIHAATPEMASAVPGPARHGRRRRVRLRANQSLHRDHCRELFHAREGDAGSAHADRGRARGRVQVATAVNALSRRERPDVALRRRFAGCDVGAVQHGMAHCSEPVESGLSTTNSANLLPPAIAPIWPPRPFNVAQ